MTINFEKYSDKLVPAIIQDQQTRNVLMLGFMNREAYDTTRETGKVTFFSRKKKRLWTKGEESGNYLELVDIQADCDNDSLLVIVNPTGPVCHKGTDTCWGTENKPNYGFLTKLEEVIEERKNNLERQDSYVSSLFNKGVNKIAQKVGEEAVELIIESMDDNDPNFLNEAADLFFHTLILLHNRGFHLDDIVQILKSRRK